MKLDAIWSIVHSRWSMAFLFLAIGFSPFGCSRKVTQLSTHFDASPVPPLPNYSLQASWAALPEMQDAADSIPLHSSLRDEQASAPADVFFIYPTIFTGKPHNQYLWNADVNDAVLCDEVQRSTILNQASVFNGSCRVFAPYYRQAHLYSFYASDPEDGRKALELAYQDVKTAFEFYLKVYNHDRPIVIGAHSQGSYHAIRLLKEFFDGKPLQKQLVMAYLPGRAIPENTFENIHPCKTADDTGVWASWNTFARGYFPDNYGKYYMQALSTNPLLWNSSEEFAPKELNKGGVGLKFTMVPQLVDAQNHQHLLWTNKPYVKGAKLLNTKVWHRADINFFYMSIRENVKLRIERYQKGGRETR